MVIAAPPPARTVRSALAVARSAYEDFASRAIAAGGQELERHIERSYSRGAAVLDEITVAADFALSDEAAEALQAYLTSLRTDDLDAMLIWLAMFPDSIRALAQRAAGWQDAPEVQFRGDEGRVHDEPAQGRSPREDSAEYQPGLPARRTPTIAA